MTDDQPTVFEAIANEDLGAQANASSQPMPEAERIEYEARLDSVPRAHSAAAALLHTLFAG
jgi:hypothetical protein